MGVEMVLTYKGQTKTAQEWIQELGVGYATFFKRLERHRKGKLSWDKVFSPPMKRGLPEKKIRYGGKTRTIAQWAAALGITKGTFCGRLFKYGERSPMTFQVGSLHRAKKYKHGNLNMTIDEWARHLGIARVTMGRRLAVHGPDAPEAFRPYGRSKMAQ